MIIGISGKARSGKDTLSTMLMHELVNRGYKYTTMAYADDLKERMMVDFNLSHAQVYGDLKEVPDKRYPKKDEGYWTPREILQYMGTEGFRAIEPSFWVRQLFEKIDKLETNNVIVTDCRFPDEVDAVLDAGGIHIRIEREGKDYATNMQHESELALDDPNIFTNFTVLNNETLEELEESVVVLTDWILMDNEIKQEIGGV